uniref:Uncharacterized protein n=1 Tax=Solanum tuberosum TaxID=4113 RepID=M1DAV9_SOLTU
MARTNFNDSGMPPQKRAWGIVINEEVDASNAKGKKLRLKGGKGKGKVPIAETSEYNSGSEGESCDSQASFSEPEDDQLLKAHQAELRSKTRHDSSRNSEPPLQFQL